MENLRCVQLTLTYFELHILRKVKKMNFLCVVYISHVMLQIICCVSQNIFEMTKQKKYIFWGNTGKFWGLQQKYDFFQGFYKKKELVSVKG